jgi:hypothetical protein
MHPGPGLILCLALAALVAQPATAAQSTPSQPAAKENFFKRTGKTIGHDAKVGWQQAKAGYKKGAKDIGHRTASAAKRVGHEMKDSAKRTGEAVKQEFN